MKVVWWIIVGYFKIIVSWLKMLNKDKRALYNKRYIICKSCEYLESSLWEYCQICGCYVKAKTKVNKASCPKGYW